MSLAAADALIGIFGMKRVVTPNRKDSKLNPKICKHCGKGYTPARPMQKACSLPCAQALGKAKTAADAKKADAKALRAGRESLKTRSDHAKDTEKAVNTFVRIRDKDKPCISCQRHHQGQNHAGHFLSVGSHPELRFEPRNIFKQCKPCNVDKHGNLLEYRKNLIALYGQEEVDWLEGPHEMTHYSIPELKAIAAKFRKMTKELINGQ